MVDKVSILLSTIGAKLYAVFVLPGSYLLSKFAAIAPVTAMQLGITEGQTEGALPVTLSVIAWITLLILLIIAWRVIRNWVRFGSALTRTAWFRFMLVVSSYKTRLVLKLRSFAPHRQARVDTVAPAVEFDELDLAVLDSVSAKGPGFTLSAPELAERLSMLPSQIQQSLDKLSRNRMLSSAIGSTDGFDNYRLTDSGAAFVSMWQRQESRG